MSITVPFLRAIPSHVGLLLSLFLYAVRSHKRVSSLFLYAVRSHVRGCYPCVFLLPYIVAGVRSDVRILTVVFLATIGPNLHMDTLYVPPSDPQCLD